MPWSGDGNRVGLNTLRTVRRSKPALKRLRPVFLALTLILPMMIALPGFLKEASAAQTVKIVIDSVAVGDSYLRYHGMKIDGPLTHAFWIDDPSSVIGTAAGSFHYETILSLSDGSHYVTYAVSSYVGYWHTKISFNGVLVGEGDNDAYHHLVGSSATPKVVEQLHPWTGVCTYQDFMAGRFNPGGEFNLLSVPRVRATVSFPSTTPTVIPQGNYIANGMFLQGEESATGPDQTDYGFMGSLSLDTSGNIQYNMVIWKTFEGDSSGHLPYSTLLARKAIPLSVNSIADPVTLTMTWDTSGYIFWFYKRPSDSADVEAFNYKMVSNSQTIIKGFFVGQSKGSLSGVTAIFFQFGIYDHVHDGSTAQITSGGWNARIENPQYYTNNQWLNVEKATSVSGDYSYLDLWWGWGCGHWSGISIRSAQTGGVSGNALEFYYSGTTIGEATPLWNNYGKQVYNNIGSLSGSAGSYTMLSVPNLSGSYVVGLVANEISDFDLYIKWNSPPSTNSYDQVSASGTSAEYSPTPTSGSGTLYIMVYLYAGSGGRWMVNVLTADSGYPYVHVISGRSSAALSGTGNTATYSISAITRAWGRAWIYLSGPDGNDFDLYAKWGAAPTTSNYDCRGYSGYPQEICATDGVEGAYPSYLQTLYYMVRSYSGSGEYTMFVFIF